MSLMSLRGSFSSLMHHRLQRSPICLHARNASSPSGKKLFDKILIANRGEIAIRVMKTARKLGIKTVAVYSDADKGGLHTRWADEAVNIGPAVSAKSYLNQDAVLDAIRKTGAQAVHPGYGFLSENAGFAEAVAKNGAVFIGPKPYALKMMGDKISSKQCAMDAKVNTIPGHAGVVKDAEEVIKIANKLGYPVMIKAVHGGGGKGMRVAWNDQEARDGFRLSTQEAMSSFASGEVFVEKFIEQPRHIEIQILADGHGNAIYLNERECSIQRRNQKVLEEAPSTFLDPATRKAMGDQAVRLAKAVQYQSAGTCEFLVDKNRNFYFLEMNTRLQVEHPVTEQITGVDLVEMMIRVAAGEKLPIAQEQVGINGWALEARVYAEDPLRGFLPSIGRLKRYVEPKGEGVRCDSGIEEGAAISIYYDPMICKLITYGPNREDALKKMRSALDSYVIRGVTHNINFLREIVDHPRVISGDISTKFIPEEYPEGFKGHKLTEAEKTALRAAGALIYTRTIASQTTISGKSSSFNADAFLKERVSDLVIKVNGEAVDAKIDLQKQDIREQQLTLHLPSGPVKVSSSYVRGDLVFVANIDGKPITLQVIDAGEGLGKYTVQLAGTEYSVEVYTKRQNDLLGLMPKPKIIDSTKLIQSPMPGAVFSVNVQVGDKVVPGQEVCVVEAMKMQNALRAVNGGVVKAVRVKPGQNVARDEILVEFE